MSKQDLRNTKYKEHVNAIEKHQLLLEKLHLDSGIRLDEAKASLENLAITLEEYLKLIGIP
ncbi:MAG: hypothetical protein Q8R23_06220 [Methylotenera sp.]|nr:hypothetical protein [Methylotenera sp.]OGV76631.1 MAG: hypothetical protein A3I83_02660 [Methylotenera sp. RIFCSPLOWO2_02_FULL_45_14]